MRKSLTLSLMLLGLVGNSFASSDTNEAWKNINQNRDATINVYGVGAKTDKNQDSSAGIGVMLDSEAIKVKIEGTSDFIKSGAVVKFNPFNPSLYFKVGLNYINQKIYSPIDTSTRVNQYSSALSSGYMLRDDFYVELGGAYTKLDGKVFGDYEIKDETTSLAYLEVAKRWDGSFGTLDTTANGGQVFHEFVDDEFSGGVGVDYYPISNAKIGYNYQYEKENIVNVYSAQYSFLFIKYIDSISLNIYQVNAGLKIAYENIFDFSTYKAPTNIKPHLSELHRFENITFSTNMAIQSNAGVQMTQKAKERHEKAKKDYDEAINTLSSAPEVSDITDTTMIVKIPKTTDVVKNLVVRVYSDKSLKNFVVESSDGELKDLASDTEYYIVIVAEVLNIDNNWETIVSKSTSASTSQVPDAKTTVSAPSEKSKTSTSINFTKGTFSDSDGVRNVTVKLYSDSSLQTLVSSSATGVFTGLNANTTYYAVTSGEALNATTGIWEEKVSSTTSAKTSPPPISTPTISLANQTVNDNGGFGSTDLPAPSVSNVQAGAVYSIVNDPTNGMLTVNSSTGVATWLGDIIPDQTYNITERVVNPDGGTATTTFTLTVINNG